MTRKTILFVDDEPDILKGLRRMLYPLRAKWDMLFVESGAEALETMRDNKISVLITDMRMPAMNGVQLLQTVREHNPEIIRVMLTGQPDLETYREVVILSHYFLWKPTKYEDFEALFDRIGNLDATLKNDKLEQFIGGIRSLPSLPVLFTRLTALLEQDNTDCVKIAGVIEEDMAMAAQVLKLVNSSFLGLSREIETLEQAVAYLGLKMIRDLVLVQQLFSKCTREEIRDFQLDQLWEHSFKVATLARKIAVANNAPEIQESAYLAGLLHDIGKLILVRHIPENYRKIMENAEQSGGPCTKAEQELLGADHASIGGYLISLWGLPRSITEAVTLHHTDFMASAPRMSPVLEAVWHANCLCHGNDTNSIKYKEFVMKHN